MSIKMTLLYLLIYIIHLVVSESALPDWHLKPIGSHVAPNKVDETFIDSMISPEDFAVKYVLPRKPLVFRNVAQKWPAFKLWTDEFLKENYGDMELRLEAKKEKRGHIPKGDVCLGRDRMKTFLNEYQTGVDKYVVSELPTPMWKDVHVPPPMGCGDFVKNFVEIDMWINSDTGKKDKGGNSILHKDAFNTVNCVINGTKDWKLIALKYNDYVYQSWEGPSEAGFGGFSLVNPDKVDAKKFPNFGKIPEWQLTRIKAGDCLYLPSQMWHQVKSRGDSNKAVAFLFSRFESGKINTSDCPDVLPEVPLSDVDVDLQYPGHGLMTMGDNEIEQTAKDLLHLVDEKKGIVTKKNVFRMVFMGNQFIAKHKEVSVKKATEFYQYLLSLAEGDKNKMTLDFVANLTRDQIRTTYKWIFKEEPSNSYNYEYSYINPTVIYELVMYLSRQNDGKLEKKKFVEAYENMGGTNIFAENFWKKLAGDKEVVTEFMNTLNEALEPYEYYKLDDDEEGADDEARITTPQGHISEPKNRLKDFNDKDEHEDNEQEGINGNEEDSEMNGGQDESDIKDEL